MFGTKGPLRSRQRFGLARNCNSLSQNGRLSKKKEAPPRHPAEEERVPFACVPFWSEPLRKQPAFPVAHVPGVFLP
ncbi:hypothetical protein H1215_09580, partial [Anoxybacillus sp. LAT_38]